jgi:hypothetical protein
MTDRRPVVLRAEGHKDLLALGYAAVRTKYNRATLTKVKQVSAGVPDEFVGKAEGKDVRSLIKGEGRVERRHNEPVTDV